MQPLEPPAIADVKDCNSLSHSSVPQRQPFVRGVLRADLMLQHPDDSSAAEAVGQ
jgi:hypothetical protein